MADAPEYFGRTQVGTISTPALSQGEVGGTSHVLNSAGRSRPRKGAVGRISSPMNLQSPLDTAAHTDIISAAGLGRRAPDGKSRGEELSDASEPDQAVKADANGAMTHYRRNPGDFVQQTPVGSFDPNVLDNYPTLSHTSMTVPDLQSRLGVPNLFGNEA